MISKMARLSAAAILSAAFATPVLAQAGAPAGAPSGAPAAGPASGIGPVAAACKDEIKKHCAGKEHGAGDVRKCLEAKKAELSGGCKTALDSTGPGKGMGGMGGMSGQQGMGGMGGNKK